MRLNYNVHEAINFRSHRDGLVNELMFPMKIIQFHYGYEKLSKFIISQFPASHYPLYAKHYSKQRGMYPFPIINLR